MDLSTIRSFGVALRKEASLEPWKSNPGAFADVAAELDDGDGFSVSDLRRYLSYPQSRSWITRPTKNVMLWTSSDAGDWLIHNPDKHHNFVRWSRGA
jgi:hypothetical protein